MLMQSITTFVYGCALVSTVCVFAYKQAETEITILEAKKGICMNYRTGEGDRNEYLEKYCELFHMPTSTTEP